MSKQLSSDCAEAANGYPNSQRTMPPEGGLVLSTNQAPAYIALISASANSEHFTSVAPSIRRAKS
jgi:hypothetical protein